MTAHCAAVGLANRRTHGQCKGRMKTLLGIYNSELRTPSQWRWFGDLDAVLAAPPREKRVMALSDIYTCEASTPQSVLVQDDLDADDDDLAEGRSHGHHSPATEVEEHTAADEFQEDPMGRAGPTAAEERGAASPGGRWASPAADMFSDGPRADVFSEESPLPAPSAARRSALRP